VALLGIAPTSHVQRACHDSQHRLRGQVQREQDLADRLRQEHSGAEQQAFSAQVTKLKAVFDGGDYATVEATLRGGHAYHTARQAAMESQRPKK
jgi:hypothetical protein